MTPDAAADSTRDRILAAACKQFAEKGYGGASVTRICQMAEANIAAVSYYFGGKASLYQHAWRRAHGDLLTAVPPDGGVDASRPAEERLRGRISAALQRAMRGDAIEFGIMRHEMASPTGLLRQVIDDTIRPLRDATQAILRELLGPRATDLDIELCEVCVVAPWMHLTHRQQAAKYEGLAPVFDETKLEAMVDHFTAFALAGIRETRSRIEPASGQPRPAGKSGKSSANRRGRQTGGKAP